MTVLRLAFARLEQRRFRRDRHRLGQVADTQLHVDGRDLADLQAHVFSLMF